MYKKRLETWLEVVVGKNDPDALGLQNASGQIECRDDLVDFSCVGTPPWSSISRA